MFELIQFAFSPVNLIFTLMLILILLYWLSVIFGLLDLGHFDANLDIDGDVDVPADSGFLHSFAEFFALGRVPFMVLLSILFINLWMLSIVANSLFNPNSSLLRAAVIFLPNFLLSCAITKIILIPITRVFENLNDGAEADRPMIGQICKVTTTEVSDKLGQAEILTNGSPILLNVISSGGRVFHKGDEAVIVERDDTRGVYLIAPLNMET